MLEYAYFLVIFLILVTCYSFIKFKNTKSKYWFVSMFLDILFILNTILFIFKTKYYLKDEIFNFLVIGIFVFICITLGYLILTIVEIYKKRRL